MKYLLNLIITKIQWWSVLYFLIVLSAVALLISVIIDDMDYFFYSLTNFLMLVMFLFGDIVIQDWKERRRNRIVMKVNKQTR